MKRKRKLERMHRQVSKSIERQAGQRNQPKLDAGQVRVNLIEIDGATFDLSDSPIVLDAGDRFQIANRENEGLVLDVLRKGEA